MLVETLRRFLRNKITLAMPSAVNSGSAQPPWRSLSEGLREPSRVVSFMGISEANSFKEIE